ncbi:MAG: radical SAM protein [Candidatus Scalindua sp.]
MSNNIAFIDFQKPYRNQGVIEAEVPLGFLFLSHPLKKEGYSTKLFSYWKGVHNLNNFLNDIVAYNPKICALNGTFGIFGSELVEILEKIKSKLPDIISIFGGIAVSSCPESYLQEKCVDYVCLGEGEFSFLQFCNAVFSGNNPQDIPGICNNLKDREINNEIQIIPDLSKVDMDLDLIDWNDYTKKIGKSVILYSLQTSRGCPFSCNFCYRSAIKVKYRMFPIEKIISWVSYIKSKTNCNYITMIDDHFFVNKRRSFELIKRFDSIGVSLSNLDLRMEDINDELFDFAQRYNIKSFFVGLESPLDHVLKRINKRITNQQIENVCNILQRWPNIAIAGSLMLCTPGMTDQDLVKTINFAIEKLKTIPNFVMDFTVFKPFPGTVFYKEIISHYPQYTIKTLKDYEICGSNGRYGLEWCSVSEKYRLYIYELKDFFMFNSRVYRMLSEKKIPLANIQFKIMEYQLKHFKLISIVNIIFYFSWNFLWTIQPFRIWFLRRIGR